MNSDPLCRSFTRSPSAPLARLADPHGYRFEGDNVELQARFTVLDPEAHQCEWALQLWACPSAPTSAQDLAGLKVAEALLPPMRELADETEHLRLTAFACPPAGNGEHFIALVLAAGQAGKFDEIHDFISYPRLQRFLQPRMRGEVSYRIEGERVLLSVEHVENPRDAANVSGTLALELWALPTPYAGGSFQGVPTATVVIGSLFGQTESTLKSLDAPFSAPPPGEWHFVLMLREWTTGGYVTRDFTNFSHRVHYDAAPLNGPIETAAPIPAAANPVKPAVNDLVQPTAATQLRAPEPSCERAAATAPENASALAKALDAGLEPKAPPEPAPPKAAVDTVPCVPVNTATEKELAAVKGISPQLARAIIRKRPFASLDDLRRVRGVTLKLLATFRSRLKI